MTRHKHGWQFLLAAVALFSILAAPCLAQDTPPEITFRHMAVMPFLVGARPPELDETMDQTLICPIDQLCTEDPSLPPRTGKMMTTLVDQQVRDRYGQRVVAEAKVQAAVARIRLKDVHITPRALARKLNKALNVELVMVGTVWRYRERGAILGVPDSPASLAFALYLVDARSGMQLWRGMFDGTQQTVLSNLLHAKKQLKMGLTWLSADELAHHGVQEVFEQFPANLQPTNGHRQNP